MLILIIPRSYTLADTWVRYRNITPKARLVPLTTPFLDYLRADGIILPTDDDAATVVNLDDNDSDEEDEDEDVASEWRKVHSAIKTTIAELGGKVFPKLNWSAPKDATWINANTMECRSPNDIYLLLKSSDFITYDLEHAFDDTVDPPSSPLSLASIPYFLILRKAVSQWNPSVEFRCFVRRRRLLCICQRDLNYFDFLFKMSRKLRSLIQEFFDVRLRDSFPNENFAFDVYVPPPYDRVWLVDINPWAMRTDPLLFSWMELLTMPDPPETVDDEPFVRLSLKPAPDEPQDGKLHGSNGSTHDTDSIHGSSGSETEDIDDLELLDPSDVDEDDSLPELRLIRKSDPEAFAFNAPKYSAHKLPKDVVQAAQSGEGLSDFVRDWRDILAKRQTADARGDDGSGDE